MLLRLRSLSCLGVVLLIGAEAAASSPVRINEIYYHPAKAFQRGTVPSWKRESAEWIELFNASDKPFSLAGYYLDGAICFSFSSGIAIDAHGYLVLARKPGVFLKKYTDFCGYLIGPYRGHLRNSGDRIVLLDPAGKVVDAVAYDDESPWPRLADGMDYSLERRSIDGDSASAMNWRASNIQGGTPAYANSRTAELTTAQVPTIDFARFRERPHALGFDPDTVLTLDVRVLEHEQMTRIILQEQPVDTVSHSSAEHSAPTPVWKTQPLRQTEPGIYEVRVGPYPRGTLLRWRIQADHPEGHGQTIFPADNVGKQSNSTFFWDDPGYLEGGAAASLEAASQGIPVYLLICLSKDLTSQSHSQSWNQGSSIDSACTLIANGQVYENVHVRPRGGDSRQRYGQKGIRLRFTQQDPFITYPPSVISYPRQTLKLVAARGLFGLNEMVGYELYRKAGVLSPRTRPVYLTTVNRNGELLDDYSGIYLDVEAINKDFCKANGISPRFIYKLEGTPVLKYSHGPNQRKGIAELLSSREPLQQFSWGAAHIELSEYMAYRAVTERIGASDLDGRNHYLVKDKSTNKWHIVPWDLSATFGTRQGRGVDFLHPLVTPFLGVDSIQEWNRLKQYVLSDSVISVIVTDCVAELSQVRAYCPNQQRSKEIDQQLKTISRHIISVLTQSGSDCKASNRVTTGGYRVTSH